MTDTISSTPEPSRPQPGSEPLRSQQRFRLSDAQSSNTGKAGDRPATEPNNPQTPFAQAAAAPSGGGAGAAGRPGAPGSPRPDGARTRIQPQESRSRENRR